MKKRIYIIGFFLSMLCCSCSLFDEEIEASGVTITEEHDLSDISGISVTDGLVVTMKQSPNNIMTIETDSAYRQYYNIVSDKGMIRISKDKDVSFGTSGLTTITIYKEEFSTVNVSGGSELRADMIKGKDVSINVSGGAVMESLLNVINLDLYLSGGSELMLSGQCERINMESTGGSELEAEELDSRYANLTLSGGSEAELAVSDSLWVKASGGSSLRYHGEPMHVTNNSSGGSTVEQD